MEELAFFLIFIIAGFGLSIAVDAIKHRLTVIVINGIFYSVAASFIVMIVFLVGQSNSDTTQEYTRLIIGIIIAIGLLLGAWTSYQVNKLERKAIRVILSSLVYTFAILCSYVVCSI